MQDGQTLYKENESDPLVYAINSDVDEIFLNNVATKHFKKVNL